MTFAFMSDGIPIVYYGQEQYFSGNADPVRDTNHLLYHLLIVGYDSSSSTENLCGHLIIQRQMHII